MNSDTPINNDSAADYTALIEELRQQTEQLIANSEALVESNAALSETVQQQTEQLNSLIEGVGLIFGAIVVTIVYNILCAIILIGWAIRYVQDRQEIRKAQQEQREKEAKQARQGQKEAIAAALGVDVEEINEIQKQRRDSD